MCQCPDGVTFASVPAVARAAASTCGQSAGWPEQLTSASWCGVLALDGEQPVSLLVAVLLARGRLTRTHGLLLLAIWAAYMAAQVWAG